MTTRALVTLPLLATSLLAQLHVEPLPMRGMMSSFPAGLVFDSAPSKIVRKRPGLPAELDSFEGTGGSGVPEFTVDAIMECLNQQANGLPLFDIEIDAMSTGNDLLPIAYFGGSDDFRITVGNSAGWATLYLSRTLPPGNGNPDVGADIVGYYFDNPTFPAPFRLGIYTEILRSDFTPALAAPANIAAMDFAMGLIEANRGQRDRGVIETLNKLYFSLTPGSAAQPFLAQAVGATGSVDGATIFEASFDPSSGRVVQVSVQATRADLLLPPGTDVDALGMFWVRPSTPPPAGLGLAASTFCYILSANDGQLGEELMVVATPYNPNAPTQPPSNVKMLRPLHTAQGQILMGVGGALQGRIKGICSQDPDFPFGCMTFGTPIFDFLPATPRMGLSLTARDLDPLSTVADSFTLTGVLSGWGNQKAPGQVLLAIEHPLGTINFKPLLNRAVDQDVYTFQLDMSYPWQSGDINDYKFMIVTTPLPVTSTSVWDGSINSIFRRRAVP